MKDGEWYNVFECTCGKYREWAWRDNRFFLSTMTCPECGTSNSEWVQKTIRYNIVKSFWFISLKKEVEYLDEYNKKEENLKNLEKVFKII